MVSSHIIKNNLDDTSLYDIWLILQEELNTISIKFLSFPSPYLDEQGLSGFTTIFTVN